MARVSFTQNLRRHVDCESVEIAGRTVREVLDELRDSHPQLAHYVVDERGALRKHIQVFVGSSLVRDREVLDDEVEPSGEIYILQALSGG
ncbi:MAG: MoaD/ThiS family protein [Planctomycetota bacterium]